MKRKKIEQIKCENYLLLKESQGILTQRKFWLESETKQQEKDRKALLKDFLKSFNQKVLSE